MQELLEEDEIIKRFEQPGKEHHRWSRSINKFVIGSISYATEHFVVNDVMAIKN